MGSLQLLTKTSLEQTATPFPVPGASAHVISPNPTREEEKAVTPCQQAVLCTCQHQRSRGMEYRKRW